MRIGMILDKVFPPDPRVENEAISLIENGYEVFLFCLKYDKNEKNEVINGIQVKRYLSSRLEYKLSALAYTFPFYTNLMKRKIVDFISINKIEALHIHDIRIAEAVFMTNEIFKLPTVLDLHENLPAIMRLYPHLQKFPGKQIISIKKWKQKEEEFIIKADTIVLVTEESKNEIIGRIDKNVDAFVLVPNTVHQSFYKNASIDELIVKKYKDDFVILYLGDTGLRRGLLTVIDSIPILKERIPNIKLVIVGKNTTDSILKEQVKNLQIEELVDFEGWKDVAFFPSYIVASSVCISPLLRNLHHDTTFANKLFQYMSFARPLLVSDAIAQKNLIEKTNSGLVHKENSTSDFSDKILKLHANDSLRKKLGENGKRFIEEEFCWEKTSQNLIRIYKGFKN